MLQRNIVLLFALAVVIGSVHAQVRPGLKMGYNFGGVMANYHPGADKTIVPGNPDNFKMKSGFQIGLITDCPISETFAIQPGARFSMQGFIDRFNDNGKSTRRFSLFYLQVPVYAQYRLNVYEETNVLFQAGPYVGYGLFGRHSWMKKGKDQMGESDKKITFGNGTTKDISNGMDYGIGAGVGIEFYRFQLMVTYDFGLYEMTFKKDNMKSAKYDVDMRNHNLSVTFAVIFGRRDPLQGKE